MSASGTGGIATQTITRNLPQGAAGTKTITEQWLDETEFNTRVSELYALKYNVQTSYDTGIYNLTATIGSDAQDNTDTEPEEAQWQVQPQFVEKPILESEVPLIAALSSDTIEALRLALKNPKGQFDVTATELTSFNLIRNIMALGIEGLPYYTVNLSRTMRVSRTHVIRWANPQVNDRKVYSKNALIAAYNIPAYVAVQMPESMDVTLTNGITAFWGYYPKWYSTSTAPKNSLTVSQEFLYDRWITSADMFVVA